MNGRKYIMQQKLKKDKARFKKKLYLSNQIEFFTTQIKSLSSQISDILSKKNKATVHSENTEDILKHYIAELNLKIYPDNYKKNYGDENIRINLSNLRALSNFQKIKRDALNKDKNLLEDNIQDLIYYLEEHRKKKIKKQVKKDINRLEFYEENRKEHEEMKILIPELLHKEIIIKNNFRESKFLYKQMVKQNKKLVKNLQEQKDLNKYLKQEIENLGEKEKICRKKSLMREVGNFAKTKKKFEKMRSLSEENFLFDHKSKNYYEQICENKNKKRTIHSLLFDRPIFEGYKSQMSFLNFNKIKSKNLVINERPINAYNYLNIFTNNKRYNSIGEFIDNFNTINNKKLSFYKNNNNKTPTKTITTPSNFSSQNISEKNKNKKRLPSSQDIKKDNMNELIILKDYLCDLIDQQRKIIKDLTNKKAEEIRSKDQVKTFISDCIDDINNNIFELKENIIEDENKEELIKQNENFVYILSYIFDNCFSGIKGNIKKLINKSKKN